MPAKGKGEYQRQGQSNLRGRFHDYNSQRRNRKQRTVTWDAYKKRTSSGRRTYIR